MERYKNQPFGMPKYSIVIPTRNRVEYLPYAIESVLSNKRDDIEVVVSDNHSLDGTSEYLLGLSDRRLTVVKPPIEMPMTAHYEYALSQAKGEWVSILGDDDAVMPYIFERLDVFTNSDSNIDIISSERAYYFWPGCEDLYGDAVVSYRRGPKRQIRSTKGDLLLALAGLRSCFNLPQIYTTCIVKRVLVDKIRSTSGGRVYHSIIPDMYSVVALSLTTDAYMRVEEPLFWTGTSNKSLGRSDRIYRDTESLGSSGKNNSAFVFNLNDKVSQALHSFGFSSLYLYEAILQCPLSVGIWRGQLVAATVYASLIVEAGDVSISRNISKEFLLEQIKVEIKNNNVSLSYVYSFVLLVQVLKFFRWILRLPVRVYVKVQNRLYLNSIFSTNRPMFPNILAASDAVEQLSK